MENVSFILQISDFVLVVLLVKLSSLGICLFNIVYSLLLHSLTIAASVTPLSV